MFPVPLSLLMPAAVQCSALLQRGPGTVSLLGGGGELGCGQRGTLIPASRNCALRGACLKGICNCSLLPGRNWEETNF